jgi:gamma-glutamylcyclotransferase (GGCT)/AIG2-like uncharacterized protein YtfP
MKSQGVYYLFVYGSLRKGFQSSAYEYISRYFELVGDARVRGCLVDLGPYPAGVPDQTGDRYIVGELYKIKNENEFSWAIGQLDDYEGMDPESDEIQLYRRELTDVQFNNEVLPAWIYWYNGDVTGKPVIDSGDLLQYLQQKK